MTVPEAAPPRGAVKSPAAFRTIAEVAADLDLPAHVLRFWESKFPQIKPLKRRGGRRYYRPEDVALLRRIRGLLYTEGYTIKGVQRLLRESGGRSDAVPLAEEEGSDTAAAGPTADREPGAEAAATASVQAETDRLAFSTSGRPASGGDKEVLRQVLADLEAIRALLREHGY